MIGQRVGNYRIVRQLGQGGMGQVFEAVADEIQGRAAIKILNPEFSSDTEVVSRFLNEARAVNVVQHPSIVSVFESGQLPNGTAYITMEYLEGVTLSSLLSKAALPERTALQIARQLASVLAATHAKDIVHRDLKPDNVMLVNDAEVIGGRRVKLLDFGIAKVSLKHQRNAVRTKDGTMMGTPAYMPPELWMSAARADAKTDVYALGALLFEMLAGRPPFVGDNINQFMFKHVNEEPPPIQQLAPRVAAGTARLLVQMLKKESSERPTMVQVVEAVEALLAQALDESVPAPNKPVTSDIALQPTMLQGDETAVKPQEPSAQPTQVKVGAAPAEPPRVSKRASGPIRLDAKTAIARPAPAKNSSFIALAVVGAAIVLSAVLALLILR